MTLEIEFSDSMKELDLGWAPVVGAYTNRFVESKTAEPKPAVPVAEMQRILSESTEILGRSCNPSQAGSSNAGLVVGYVQSGKTLSFTTVAALARDNGFGAVIVLAGSTNNLKNQSEVRLVDDLGISEVRHAWIQEASPAGDDATHLRQILSEWRRHRDGQTKRAKPALLLTVLKHYGRISNTAECLSRLQDLLQDIPVLVIDDESDQASPNTKARTNLLKNGTDKSQTYDAILALRSSLPHHTYLQYTATPQANLLLAIADTLNPDFAKVIEPGGAYVGGKDFFGPSTEGIVVELSAADICDPKNLPADPPESLLRAFQLFLLGASVANMAELDDNRSMLVQVSQPKAPHSVYAEWLSSFQKAWKAILEDETDLAYHELVSEFSDAYTDLAKTASDIPPFSDVLEWIAETLSEVRIVTVNSNVPKDVNWNHAHYWVLVGGMKLDRGYTVEGLTVTYMPREVSENADVLQQRARFFGYKRNYFGYCRVFIPRVTRQAFEDYANDEEFLRQSLVRHAGKPLAAWRRDFLTSPNIRRLTRSAVVGRKMKRLSVDEGWVFAKSMSLGISKLRQNQSLFVDFVNSLASQHETQRLTEVSDAVDRRSSVVPTTVTTSVPTGIISKFLLGLQLEDVGDRTMVTAILQALTTGGIGDSGVDVVVLNGLDTGGQSGRSLSSLRSNLFVGHNPKSARDKADMLYSGDRDMKIGVRPTLQLRYLKLADGRPSSVSAGEPFPWFAFHFPVGMVNDLVLEEF